MYLPSLVWVVANTSTSGISKGKLIWANVEFGIWSVLLTKFDALFYMTPYLPLTPQIPKDPYFGYGFDGYSYAGQTDSTNQAEDDLVSTFVFSNFFPPDRFRPKFAAIFRVMQRGDGNPFTR